MRDAHTEAGRSAGAQSWLLLLLGLAAVLDGFACAARRGHRPEPLPGAAAQAFAEARALDSARTVETDPMRELDLAEQVAEAAGRAQALAPEWAAPVRLLDDLAREDLLLPDALTRHLERLSSTPDQPLALYLVGRLEGRAGEARFRRARERAPGFAWAHHGLGWMSFIAGDAKAADRHAAAALARARGAWERVFFATTRARYLFARERFQDARKLLESTLDDSLDLERADRALCAAWLARAELATEELPLVRRGYARGIALLAEEELPEDVLVRLVGDLRASPAGVGSEEALEAALASRSDALSSRLRARLLADRGEWELASAIEGGELDPFTLRLGAFAVGDAGRALDRWLADLPAVVLGEGGMPTDPRLAALVMAGRGELDHADGARVLGRALLDAGWFREARAWSRYLTTLDAEAALELDGEASRRLAFLESVASLLEGLDAGDEADGAWRSAAGDPLRLGHESPKKEDGLAGLLEALEAEHRALFPESAHDFGSSPRLPFGTLATVVHPGPRFSTADEKEGRGEVGAAVPGLAAAFEEMGRFALFGSVLGQGSDGTVLRRLGFEERSGEHLGVPFHGTVAWCERTDIGSRPARRGARIVGAALHEGYWIDVAGARRALPRWTELLARFPVGSERAARALASIGPPVALTPERRSEPYATAGLGDRLRLAVLHERAASRPTATAAELVPFDELLEAVAVHEEGHLCDRERFLPLGKNFGRAFGLLTRAGFSPEGIAKRLEYRAELVALCATADPRLPLAECLDALDGSGGPTPHAAAYAELVKELLVVLDGRRSEFPVLREDHHLVHQLHLLGPEDIRDLARDLARKVGMLTGKQASGD